MKVANRKCIRRLSIAHMKSAKLRNIITIAAVALTTILFTTLFTVGLSIKDGYEQTNFRQVGGYEHVGFKFLTKEQFDELKGDPLIQEYGVRRFVGTPQEAPFHKSHVEVSYCDANEAKYMFLEPIEGQLPKEGTNEAATDLQVLSLLGIEPVIGNEFTITFGVDGVNTTETFTLCGYWESDAVAPASHVLIPESRAEEIFARLDTQGSDRMTGLWNLDVMFRDASRIEDDAETVLARHGYQMGDKEHGENYISVGVNWGYTGAQMYQSLDFSVVLGIVAALLLIIFTGYLIIYNIFQISVANDVRFYGLLKTIGTTGRQIKRILRIQAVVLSLAGIPIGLAAGFGMGALVSHIVIASFEGMSLLVSVNPLIFIGSALFSLLTVLLSCRKPCKMAARISPMEAVRYTEGEGNVKKKKKERKYKKKKLMKKARTVFASTGETKRLWKMAWANLGRNKKKTVITVISMSLSLVILDISFILAGGFDMDKYLRDVTKDFIVADASYFNAMSGATEGISEEAIAQIEEQGVIDGGRTYGVLRNIAHQELVTEEQYRKCRGYWDSEEMIDNAIETKERVDGRLKTSVTLYGMEDAVLDALTVLEGDIDKIKEGGNYVAAVCFTGDYGELLENTYWANVGDEVSVYYVDEWELYNTKTGEVYEDLEAAKQRNPTGEYIDLRYLETHNATYEVAAVVTVPNRLSYRVGGGDEYVMNPETFRKDSGSDTIMYYAFDCADGGENAMEEFMADYTTHGEGAQCDYESKKTYEEEFNSFRNMYLIVGTALSFIVGLIGVLNFLNAILTGILTRRREFAVLQSIGMTGRQLTRMLIIEGVVFAGSSVVATLLLTIVLAPVTSNVLENMFWFFSYRLTVTPILIVAPVFLLIGAGIPMLSYHYVTKKSVVERLREAE